MMRAYKLFGAFRFMLALLVLMAHFSFDLLGGKYFVEYGLVAVFLFFVLSGFVIAEASDLFYRDRVSDFLKNRLLRIYPPYLFALLASIIIQFILVTAHNHGMHYQPEAPELSRMGHPATLFFNLIAPFDPRVVQAGKAPYPIYVRPIWALVIEILFYWNFAIAMIRRNLVMAYTLIAYLVFLLFRPQYEWLEIFTHIPYFLFGIALYKQHSTTIVLTAMLVATNCAHVAPSISFVCVFLGLTLLFIVLSRMDSKNTSIRNLDSWLGNLSYPLYLNHYVIGMGIAATLPKGYPTFFLGVLLSLMISYLGCILVEPRIQKIRDKIRGLQLN